MANISNEIRAFQNAVYGEEVRSSMISAIQKINTVTENCESTVSSFSSNISSATTAANNAASNANTAATNANNAATAANTAKNAANTAASNANAAVTSANNAASNANSAATSANNAEAARVTAENARANAESTRQANESARQSAEQARVSAEATRANSESARDSAESARQANEITRQGNERQRQNSETLRENAENSRVSGFSDMQAAFADMQRTVIPQATESTMGGVIVGDGLNVENALLSLATTKSGSGTAVTSNGAVLESVVVYGQSDQEGTPTPSEPAPVKVIESANVWHESVREVGVSYRNVGITWVKNADGTYTANGKATANAWVYAGTVETIIDMAIPLDPGIYTATTNAQRCALRKVSDGELSTLSNVFESYTFTVEDGESIFICPQVPNGVEVSNETYYVQIVPGSDAVPYTPYGSIGIVVGDTATSIDLQGNTLSSLPDGTRDEVHVDSTGHCVLTKRVKRLTYNGDTVPTLNNTSATLENWVIAASTVNDWKYATNRYPNNLSSQNTLANSYPVAMLGFASATGEGISIWADGIYLRTVKDKFADGAALQSALQAHPVEVWYQLANPQTIDLGYITPPAIPEDGATVSVSSSITPVIDVSWWENGAAAIASAISKLMDEIKSLKAQIAALATS